MTFTLNIDEEIASLKTDIVRMASLCEKALYFVSSLVDGKERDLRDIQELSDQIEKSEREIEQECMRILLRRHPVAKDLRSVSAALRIINDLERIGNNSLDLAEAINYCENRDILQEIELPKMIEEVSKMLTDATDAFVMRNEEKAEAVIREDDVLDALFVTAKEGLIRMIKSSVDGIEEAPDALLAAKYLERMGDHCVNLSRQLIWSVSGDMNIQP